MNHPGKIEKVLTDLIKETSGSLQAIDRTIILDQLRILVDVMLSASRQKLINPNDRNSLVVIKKALKQFKEKTDRMLKWKS
jgi:hypothetical protein